MGASDDILASSAVTIAMTVEVELEHQLEFLQLVHDFQARKAAESAAVKALEAFVSHPEHLRPLSEARAHLLLCQDA